MCKTFTLLAAMLTVASVAQEKPIPGAGLVPEVVPPPIPTRRIVPSEIVQESIRLVRTSTKQIGVMWTYTEAGASNMLAFREAHEDQTVRIVIGTYQGRPHVHSRLLPTGITNYAQWKESWLKYRGDKIVGVSESDAEKIVAGLKSL
jgi:hypothetical protein